MTVSTVFLHQINRIHREYAMEPKKFFLFIKFLYYFSSNLYVKTL